MNIDRIKLENFASYINPPEININQLGNTISVHGPTGAGKTTLFIDAITYALFGKAYGRDSKEIAKQVLPPNRMKTKVELDFTIANKRYRVIRILTKSASEAQLYEINEQGKLVNLVAQGIANVEREIKRLTGLDYKTFLHTVVVRQGEVDKIIASELAPRERREILLKTFNIDFTKHKEIAKEKRDKTRIKMETTRNQIEEIENKLKEKSETKNKLQSISKQIKSIRRELKTLNNQKNNLNERLNKIQEQIKEIEKKLTQYKERLENLNKIKNEIKAIEGRITKLNHLIKAEPQIKSSLEKAKDKLKKLEKRLDWIEKIEDKQRILQLLEATLKQHQKKASELEELENTFSSLIKCIQREDEAKKLAEKLEKTYNEIQVKIGAIKGRIEFLEKSINMLEKTLGKCPLCNSKLTPRKMEELKINLKNEESRLQNQIEELKAKLIEINRKLEATREELNQINTAKQTISFIRQQLEEAKNSKEKLNETREKLKEIQDELNKIMMEAGISSTINIEKIKLETAGIEEKIKMLEEKSNEITRAKGELETLQTQKINLEKQATKLHQQIGNMHELEKNLAEFQDREASLKIELNEIDRQIEALHKKKIEAKTNARILAQRLVDLIKMERKLKTLKRKLVELENLHQAYKILAEEIFHDRGLPTSLLHQYLAEVEDNARNLLQSFLPEMDISMQVDEKGQVEIRVSDRGYYRELATYSGGERILLGFAIRLAIAKTLATKHLVTAPKFLIIDEGFGPLDKQFREQVLNILYRLTQDYQKIIVISHVDEVKQSPYFATYIRIKKDSNRGSQIQIT